MSVDAAAEIVRHAVMITILVASPLLLISLIVGVIVSLIQAVTQIQEQTLTFVPKLLALGVALIILLPWILTQLTDYLAGVLNTLSMLAT